MKQMEMILLSPDQLKSVIDERLNEAFKKFLPVDTSPKDTSTTLLTRKQTAALLGISLPTLSEWTKSGEITGYRIGASVRYKKAEVEQSLSRIKYSGSVGRPSNKKGQLATH
jgi:excisionase family DNA binding protein